MHVLILPSWYPKKPDDVGGVFFRDQALALLNRGHKVGVISPQTKSLRLLFKRANTMSFPHYEDDSGIPTYRRGVLAALPRVPYGNYYLFKRCAMALFREYIRDHGMPDIIHAHSAIYGGAVAATISREFGVPIVLTEHSSGFARGVYADWQLKLAAGAFSEASALIAVSPALGEVLSEMFNIENRPWMWVPNVVAGRFALTAYDGKKKARATRFLNLALMTEVKGQEDLVTAFSYLVKSGTEAELWLAGDGPLRPLLEKQVFELGISSKVRFLGMIEPESVPELLTQVDVMVVSSRYETFGVVAAEALMAGVPVVATRCGGPDCIVREDDGFLVPPNQPSALADAMKRADERLADFHPARLSREAKERFSSEAIAERLTVVFTQAAQLPATAET